MRFRRMERRCAGVVDAAGVAGGEMGEDSLDDVGRLDARYLTLDGREASEDSAGDVEYRCISCKSDLVVPAVGFPRGAPGRAAPPITPSAA